MAGAGFAAGFFGEATNIMREKSKQTREDELIAKELEQKDKDWARSTQHELNMVTARYDLETKAARTETVNKVANLAQTLINAGVKPEEIAQYTKDPASGVMHLESMLNTITSNKMNPTQVRTMLDSVGMEGVNEDVATTVKSSGASGAALSFEFASAASPRAKTSPEESRLVSEQAVNTLRSSALADKAKWSAIVTDEAVDAEAKTIAIENVNRIDTALNDADKNKNIDLLMNDYGVKAVYDMLNNPGLSANDILVNPDLQRNPAVVEKAYNITGTSEFLGEQVESPYAALELIQRDISKWRTLPTYGAMLENFVTVYDKSFLPPELAKDYKTYITQQ